MYTYPQISTGVFLNIHHHIFSLPVAGRIISGAMFQSFWEISQTSFRSKPITTFSVFKYCPNHIIDQPFPGTILLKTLSSILKYPTAIRSKPEGTFPILKNGNNIFFFQSIFSIDYFNFTLIGGYNRRRITYDSPVVCANPYVFIKILENTLNILRRQVV